MTEEERLHQLLYSCDSRDEICERTVNLEYLCRDLWESITWMDGMSAAKRAEYERRICELGLID